MDGNTVQAQCALSRVCISLEKGKEGTDMNKSESKKCTFSLLENLYEIQKEIT